MKVESRGIAHNACGNVNGVVLSRPEKNVMRGPAVGVRAVENRQRTRRRAKVRRKSGDAPAVPGASAGKRRSGAGKKQKAKGGGKGAERSGLRRAGSTPDGKDTPRDYPNSKIG